MQSIAVILGLLMVSSGWALMSNHCACYGNVTGRSSKDNVVLDKSNLFWNYGHNVIKNKTRLWPNKTVYYTKAPFLPDFEKKLAMAMDDISKKSCIVFKETDDDHETAVMLVSVNGYIDYAVGYQGYNYALNFIRYKMVLDLFTVGEIQHILLHAIGFYNMHNAYNRDKYVRIFPENIIPTAEKYFVKNDYTITENFGEKYDFGSIMHGGPCGHSMYGTITMLPINDPSGKYSEMMGQRKGMSPSDIRKLNRLYSCDINS